MSMTRLRAFSWLMPGLRCSHRAWIDVKYLFQLCARQNVAAAGAWIGTFGDEILNIKRSCSSILVTRGTFALPSGRCFIESDKTFALQMQDDFLRSLFRC